MSTSSPLVNNSINKLYFKKKITGDFVECGVFKGGNLILMNHIRNRLNLNNKIFAFDTFEGMSEPTTYDKDLKDVPADKTFEIYKQVVKNGVMGV